MHISPKQYNSRGYPLVYIRCMVYRDTASGFFKKLFPTQNPTEKKIQKNRSFDRVYFDIKVIHGSIHEMSLLNLAQVSTIVIRLSIPGIGSGGNLIAFLLTYVFYLLSRLVSSAPQGPSLPLAFYLCSL